MKKSIVILTCLALTGCIPTFNSHIQEIDLKKFYAQNPGAKVYYDDEEQAEKVKLFRSWFDKELVIKKDGFEDYNINLESVGTKDDFFSSSASDKLCIRPLFRGEKTMIIPRCIMGSIVDLVTGMISLPITYLVNPWKEYKNEAIIEEFACPNGTCEHYYYLDDHIPLNPIKELKKSCNKKGYFISNLGCTKCTYEEKVITSLDESDKCSNRIYAVDFHNFSNYHDYSYSCNDKNSFNTDKDTCERCKNRYYDRGKCHLKQDEIDL